MTNRGLCQVVTGVVFLAGCSSTSSPPASNGGKDAAADVAVGMAPGALPGPARGAGILTRGYNLQRTGTNLEETFLTPALVASPSFGKLYCDPVDDEIYAQLLYVPGLDFGAKGKHDAVYALTVNADVYAFDALKDDAPLWEKHYTDDTKGITPALSTDMAKTTCGTYKDISHFAGIIS